MTQRKFLIMSGGATVLPLVAQARKA